MAIYKLGDISNIIVGGDMPKNKSHIKTKEYSVPIISNGIAISQIMGYTNK